MANQEQLDILRQGSVIWNQWRKENPHLIRVDLTMAQLSSRGDLGGVNLSKADLTWANLHEAYLLGADFTGANLIGANLYHAFLSKANLTGADLTSATLVRANLRKANLTGADLTRAIFAEANLTGANLTGASLTGAMFSETVFGNTKLTDALGLDACGHAGPSILDHSTLARSAQLPLSFLRGCGLPDTLIAYLPSLLCQAIQYSSCFISYSTEDQEFARRLHADLQDKGVRCWFAPHNIQGGKYVHEQIDQGIQVHDRLLLILSETSIRSEWVVTEISNARTREKAENRRILFPIRLMDFKTLKKWKCFNADIGNDSAKEIRKFYVPDFSNWKSHDLYQVEFEKILRGLKTEASPPSGQ